MFVCCGCGTSYHARNLFGGYSDYCISPGKYMVKFHGNHFSSHDSVFLLSLRRAADLTLQKGFHYFSVIMSKDLTNHGVTSFGSSPYVYRIPGNGIMIQCYKECPENIEAICAKDFLREKRCLFCAPPRCSITPRTLKGL